MKFRYTNGGGGGDVVVKKNVRYICCRCFFSLFVSLTPMDGYCNRYNDDDLFPFIINIWRKNLLYIMCLTEIIPQDIV